MNKKNILLILMLLFIIPVIGQESCSITLRKAQKSYDDGIIEEVPKLLAPCLENGFTKEEKIDAYKLLILCNLYEDKMAEAEELMLDFLKTNPEYQINPSIDPAEFILLYNSYRTNEVLSVGITVGLNSSNPYSREQFGVEDINNQNTEYANTGFGFIVGPKISFAVAKDFKVNIGLLFGQKKFEYNLLIHDYSQVNTLETHNYLEFPIMVSYYRFGNDKFQPFVELGLNTSYLLNANSQTSRLYINSNNEDLPGTDIDITSKRNNLMFGILAGAGLEYKLKKGAIHANLRYSIPVNTIVNGAERYSDFDQVTKFYNIDDKVFVSNLYFSFSYMYPIYNHKKIN